MTREEYLNIRPEASEEELKAVMDLHSKGIEKAKNKAQEQFKAQSDTIESLNNQLAQRDADLEDLRKNLESFKTNKADYEKLQEQFTDLQTKYSTQKDEYDKQIADQKYSFAIRESSNSLNFSSESAKKAFLADLTANRLELKDEKLIGWNEYLEEYKKNDPKAFAEKDDPVFVKASTQKDTTSNKFVVPKIF